MGGNSKLEKITLKLSNFLALKNKDQTPNREEQTNNCKH